MTDDVLHERLHAIADAWHPIPPDLFDADHPIQPRGPRLGTVVVGVAALIIAATGVIYGTTTRHSSASLAPGGTACGDELPGPQGQCVDVRVPPRPKPLHGIATVLAGTNDGGWALQVFDTTDFLLPQQQHCLRLLVHNVGSRSSTCYPGAIDEGVDVDASTGAGSTYFYGDVPAGTTRVAVTTVNNRSVDAQLAQGQGRTVYTAIFNGTETYASVTAYDAAGRTLGNQVNMSSPVVEPCTPVPGQPSPEPGTASMCVRP